MTSKQGRDWLIGFITIVLSIVLIYVVSAYVTVHVSANAAEAQISSKYIRIMYSVETSDSPARLSALVQSKLNSGWELAGQPTAIVTKYNSTDFGMGWYGSKTMYMQALIKKY